MKQVLDGEKADARGRVVGCLLGGALGDALGYPVEFIRSWPEIADLHGREAPARLAYAHPPPALISDDTQMTMFVAEGLVRALQRSLSRGICHSASVIQGGLLRWYATQLDDLSILDDIRSGGYLVEERRLFSRRAPGNTCLSALASHVQRVPVSNCSKGCGAVMRSAPIGLGARSAEIAWEIALESAAHTHQHPSGYLSAAYFAAVISGVVRRKSLPVAMETADSLLAKAKDHEELAHAIRAARQLAAAGVPSPDAIESLGEGWTGEEALAIALACALTVEGETPEATCAARWAVCPASWRQRQHWESHRQSARRDARDVVFAAALARGA